MTETTTMMETSAARRPAAPAPAPGTSNAVTLAGRVIARWVFEGDTYLRLVALRPRGFPPAPDGRRGDVLVVRINYFLAQTAPLPERGQLCRVRGFLQQPEEEETLAQALTRLVQTTQLDAVRAALGELLDLTLRSATTEVVALGWELLPEPERRGRARRGRREPRPAPVSESMPAPGEHDVPLLTADTPA